MSHYRLLALDIDGTTVVSGRPATPRVREAIAVAQARGVHVILATGRPYRSAIQYGVDLGLSTPLICFQGALVKEVTGGAATLLAETVPPEPLAEVVALAQERQLDLTIYGEDTIYLSSMSRPRSFYDLWFGLSTRRVPSLDQALQILRTRGTAPFKGLFIGEPQDNDRLAPELAARFAGRLTVLRSHPLFVELLSPKVSKGRAVAFLAERYGVPQAETIAVGDSGNDVSMVRWAGLGVAVRNATADVLAAADWVAPPVTEDAVAVVIERFILNGS
ncbi:MAG: Cof-type HAD-IIB family hydrolase [Chloroflexi bacterium HGW-Chloroflexi-1]|nr:MAG: Cof-type HAD-IIB family hydrolase [Chloroflexi bacterium HGW-Chloroflexi-1]